MYIAIALSLFLASGIALTRGVVLDFLVLRDYHRYIYINHLQRLASIA